MAARQAGLRDGALSDPLLRTAEVQIVLGIGYSSLRKLIKAGLLKASRTSAVRGHFRIRLSEIERFTREQACD